MNIDKQQIDDLNLKLTLTFAPEDYEAQEKKKLSEYKRNAELKGFRKGMAPLSLIKHIYGDRALGDALDSMINEEPGKFIKETNLRLIGEPLPSEDQPKIELKDGETFTFMYDLAKYPEVNVAVGSDDNLTSYKIKVTDEAKKEMKENMLRQLSKMGETEVAQAGDYLVVDLENEEKKVTGAYVTVDEVAGEAKEKVIGAKAGDKFDINVNDAFPEASNRAAVLKTTQPELEKISDPLFHVTVVNVRRMFPGEENQESYDTLFGKDKVHNSEEFDKAVEAQLEANYKQESDFQLNKDIREYLVKKADIKLPEDFLKRWLLYANEGKFTKDDIEKEFDGFLKDFRWQLVRDSLMQKYGLKIEDADLQGAAEGYVRYQYAMYGMSEVPEDMMKVAVQQLLADENQARNMRESVANAKVFDAVKKDIKTSEKTVSVEDFRKLSENK